MTYPSNYQMPDAILGTKDLDDEFITDAWLVEQYVGSTLWSWGYNNYGQLGNNTAIHYSSPIQVGSLTNWKQVACGQYHTVAVKTDGSLWSCGYNNKGQLGQNNITNYSSPVQVGTLTNWKQVACGYQHTIAVTYKEIN